MAPKKRTRAEAMQGRPDSREPVVASSLGPTSWSARLLEALASVHGGIFFKDTCGGVTIGEPETTSGKTVPTRTLPNRRFPIWLCSSSCLHFA